MHDIAGDADRCARILADPAHFAALQPDNDMLALHHLGAVIASLLFLGNDGRVRAGAAAENGTTIAPGPDVVHDRTDGNHVHRQAVPPPGRLCRQNTGIDDTTHAVEEILGNAGPVALHHVSSAHALSCHDIALLPRRLLRQQGNVRAPARVVLDTLDRVRPWRPPVEVDGTNSPLVTTTTVSNGDTTTVVPATLAVALLGERQGKIGPALPQVVVDRPLEMSKTRCPRLVCSHLDRLNIVLGGSAEGGRLGTGGSLIGLQFGRIASDGANAKGALAQGGEGGCPRNEGSETWLQHRRRILWYLEARTATEKPRKPAPTGGSPAGHRGRAGILLCLQWR